MKIYKVLARFPDGALRSAWVYGIPQRTYRPGRPVMAKRSYRRKGYHLCAFLSREQAMSFLENIVGRFGVNSEVVALEVWEGLGWEIIPHDELPPMYDQKGKLALLPTPPEKRLSTFYELEIDRAPFFLAIWNESFHAWPQGTIMARVVMITKQLHREEI